MGSLSKEAVAEAIEKKRGKKDAEPDAAADTSMLGKLKGMLNPRSGPGAMANREEYLKYVDSQQSAGKPADAYDDWAKNR